MSQQFTMKKIIAKFSFVILVTLFFSCGNGSQYKIQKGKVGQVTAETRVSELESIFKKDSIVKKLSEGILGTSFSDDDKYIVYEKGGKHLLTIIPKEQLDSTSTIRCIEVYDDRFKSESGLNLSSTFADINLNNKINKVETSLSSATLFIDDINATISIDKEQLGLRAFSTEKVTLEQIPDLAKIKSFTVWFN